MGIDVHALNFLLYAKKFGNLGRTITVGRQRVFLPDSVVRNVISASSDYKNDKYCEQLLTNYFGADTVDSIDFSDFEGATIIHDMNLPIPSNIRGLYDTVIDFGSLEHVYNIPQALKNCSSLCAPCGQIIHVSPANNWCGHGFWQFSPELFFSLYSDLNGYRDTEIFLADLADEKRWFKVKPTKLMERLNVVSITKLHVLVRTVGSGMGFSHNNIQQSDYVIRWTNSSQVITAPKSIKSKEITVLKGIKNSVAKFSFLCRPLLSIYRFCLGLMSWKKLSQTSNLKNNPNLAEFNITSLL